VRDRLVRAAPSKRRIGVGDQVKFKEGPARWRARVVEDRGNLGVGGRRIMRVVVVSDGTDDPVEFELSEDHLELVNDEE
jgi:hypothetical protein